MDVEAVGVLYLLNKKRKSKRSRKWIKEMHRRRKEEGAHALLFHHLVSNDDNFHNYFRLSPYQFHELHNLLHPYITKKQSTFRIPISSQERVAITLRYVQFTLSLHRQSELCLLDRKHNEHSFFFLKEEEE